MNKSLIDRASGCLLGQLAGDALGSIVEFRSAPGIRRDYPGGLRLIVGSPVWGTLAGQPTDDSELALALAHTLVRYGFDAEQVAAAYGQWLLSNPFDVGGTIGVATRAIVKAASHGENLEQAAYDRANRDSQANGALMRQSPLAIWGHALPAAELAAIVKRDTDLTHPNPVCRDASAALIVAMSAAIREGLDGKAAYEAALEWNASHGTSPAVTEALDRACAEKPDYEKHPGHVIVALQNAMYQALHASSLEEGVVDTVMRGGDTDTNGAIAGALLGAIYGIDGIPAQWRDTVLGCEPKESGRCVQRPRPEIYWPNQALTLSRELVQTGSAQGISRNG